MYFINFLQSLKKIFIHFQKSGWTPKFFQPIGLEKIRIGTEATYSIQKLKTDEKYFDREKLKAA